MPDPRQDPDPRDIGAGREVRPVAVLLIGLTGSGKTVLSQELARHGLQRMSVDEEVFARHGRYGRDYPEHEYLQREEPVVRDIRRRRMQVLRDCGSVVLDYGLWLRSEREDWSRAVRDAGGEPVLVHLPVAKEELLRRLAGRNRRRDANALTVTPQALDDFLGRFEPPGPGEAAVAYHGDPSPVLARILASEHSAR